MATGGKFEHKTKQIWSVLLDFFLAFFPKKLLVALLDLFGLLNNNIWACSGRPKHDLVAPGDLATI